MFFWLETINTTSRYFWFLISSCRAFNFADLMSQSFPNAQNSTMWRHLPMWRHIVMKLLEYFCCILNFLRWKNEVICFIQEKVMYIFVLCKEFRGGAKLPPLFISLELLIVEKRQTPFWKPNKLLLF